VNADAGGAGFAGTSRRRMLVVRVSSAFLLLAACLLGGEVAARLDDACSTESPFSLIPRMTISRRAIGSVSAAERMGSLASGSSTVWGSVVRRSQCAVRLDARA
jgi:hypothetical protein